MEYNNYKYLNHNIRKVENLLKVLLQLVNWVHSHLYLHIKKIKIKSHLYFFVFLTEETLKICEVEKEIKYESR